MTESLFKQPNTTAVMIPQQMLLVNAADQYGLKLKMHMIPGTTVDYTTAAKRTPSILAEPHIHNGKSGMKNKPPSVASGSAPSWFAEHEQLYQDVMQKKKPNPYASQIQEPEHAQ